MNTAIKSGQGKAAALASPSLDRARELLANVWLGQRPPSKDTLARCYVRAAHRVTRYGIA